MIYPTARAVLLGALGAPITLGLALGGPRLWLAGAAWTVAVLGGVLADGLLGADRRKARLEVVGPDALALGHAGAVEVTARFEGRAPQVVELTMEVSPAAALTPSRQSAAVQAHAATVRFMVTPLRRGQAGLPRLWARWRGPLGLACKQISLACDFVAPITLDLPKVKEDASRLASDSLLMGSRLQPELGGVSEFHALTDYLPGMERRLIDWKQSARHSTLLAREFQAERNHHVVMAVDTGLTMCQPVGGLPRLDRVLHAGLLLAFAALKGGDRVGLYAFDERPRLWSGLLTGQGAFPQIQKLASQIDYSAAETNYTLGLTSLGGHLKRRALVIVFTEFTDPTTTELMVDNIARLLRTHLVLFVVIEDEELRQLEQAPVSDAADVSKAVLAGALGRERDLVIARLRRTGADILQTPMSALGPALLARYLALKQTARL